VSGDLVPVFSDMISSANPVLQLVYYPMLGFAHLLNIVSYLWIPALIVKIVMIGYVFSGRLHSETKFESFAMMSRETWLGMGAGVVGLLTFIVLVGTSMPIIPQFIIDAVNSLFRTLGTEMRLGNTVEPAFYDAMGLPLAILMTSMIGFTLLLMWNSTKRSMLWRKLLLPLGLAVTTTLVIVFVGGVHDVGMILLALSASFSFYSNVVIGYRIVRGNPKFAGAYIAHIGVALMLLGVIGSGFYSSSKSLELKQDEAVEWNGYRLTYVGNEPFWNGERFHFKVKLDDAASGKEIETINTVMFVSMYGGQEQIMRNPGIAKFLTTDVYVEPQALYAPDPDGGKRFSFVKGQSFEFGGYSVTFTEFDMNNSRTSQTFRIGGMFRIERYGEEPQELMAARTTGPEGVDSQPGIATAGDLQIEIINMTPNKEDLALSELEVRLKNPKIPNDPNDARETLVVEASLKPFISFVWVGIIIMVLGFGVARSRRASDARRLETYDIPPEVKKAALTGEPSPSDSMQAEPETIEAD
jgi:cytochrome c-type biogenesis protein CcmF